MASKSGSYDAVMPDMKLWSEIIFLQNFTKNTDIKFVVENVKPYYEPFVKPTAKLGRHLFWANFEIPETEIKDGLTHNERGSSKKVISICDHIKWNIGKTKLFVIALTPMSESMFFGVRWEIACNAYIDATNHKLMKATNLGIWYVQIPSNIIVNPLGEIVTPKEHKGSRVS